MSIARNVYLLRVMHAFVFEAHALQSVINGFIRENHALRQHFGLDVRQDVRGLGRAVDHFRNNPALPFDHAKDGRLIVSALEPSSLADVFVSVSAAEKDSSTSISPNRAITSSLSIFSIWWNIRHAHLYVTPISRSSCLALIPQRVAAIK